MESQIFKIIAAIMDVDESSISIKSSPQNVNSWDSLHHMKLILALEESLNLSFNEQDIIGMKDAETILNCIISKND